MEKILATLPSIKIIAPQDPTDYLSGTSTRRWELALNWKRIIYLTDQEKDYFMAQLKVGKKIVQIGDLILTKKFDYLIATRKPKQEPLTGDEMEAIMNKVYDRR